MKKIFFLILGSCALYFTSLSQQPSYKNKNLSPEVWTKDLLKRMNLDEKVMQTQCLWIQKPTFLNGMK